MARDNEFKMWIKLSENKKLGTSCINRSQLVKRCYREIKGKPETHTNENERKEERKCRLAYVICASTCQNSELLWTIRKTLCHSIRPFICHSCNHTISYERFFSPFLYYFFAAWTAFDHSFLCWLCDEGGATTIPLSTFVNFHFSVYFSFPLFIMLALWMLDDEVKPNAYWP